MRRLETDKLPVLTGLSSRIRSPSTCSQAEGRRFESGIPLDSYRVWAPISGPWSHRWFHLRGPKDGMRRTEVGPANSARGPRFSSRNRGSPWLSSAPEVGPQWSHRWSHRRSCSRPRPRDGYAGHAVLGTVDGGLDQLRVKVRSWSARYRPLRRSDRRCATRAGPAPGLPHPPQGRIAK